MIKNERQYRITKAQLGHFEKRLNALEVDSAAHPDPLMRQALIDAARSQYEDLESEVRDYEQLQAHRPSVIEATSLDELPKTLIRARIALGLSQRDLAEKMGIKEQQLQRYEATEYAGASLSRIREVIAALGIVVSERVFLPVFEPSREALLSRLDLVGIDDSFLLTRLLPSDIATGLEDSHSEDNRHYVQRASSVLERIYGWNASELFGAAPLKLPESATATARFKVPGGAHGRKLHAYIAYAHYLAMVVAKASDRLPKASLTTDFAELRQKLLSHGPDLGLRSVVTFFWDQGIPVLPLGDPGAFHGACWRVAGRNVIVVKHRSKYCSRWVFDLIHEWHHAAQQPGEDTHAWIEDGDITSSRRTSPEERAANKFAGNVLLDGQAESLVAECMRLTDGNIPAFKAAVPKIANKARVLVDHFADYLAWRLSLQDQNWWGAANNLQTNVGDPFSIVRDVFLERFDFGQISSIDANLLHRALGRDGDVS